MDTSKYIFVVVQSRDVNVGMYIHIDSHGELYSYAYTYILMYIYIIAVARILYYLLLYVDMRIVVVCGIKYICMKPSASDNTDHIRITRACIPQYTTGRRLTPLIAAPVELFEISPDRRQILHLGIICITFSGFRFWLKLRTCFYIRLMHD